MKKRIRAFYQQGDSYAGILSKLEALYPGAELRDMVSGGRQSPGTLLQYEETDWAFMKRLASHFSSFLVPDTHSRLNRIYFGLPDIDNGQKLYDWDYEILQDMDAYYHFPQVLRQEHISWKIINPIRLSMGECLDFNGVKSAVVGIHLFSKDGELRREYHLRKREGLLTRQEFNLEILGVSLPATVKSRKNNVVQVDFDINAAYPPEDPKLFYTYGIESSSFYCMPEVGSRLHVYFPNRDDWDAEAVHALNPGAGAGKNPSDKTFSSPSGAAVQLTPGQLSMSSDGGGSSRIVMGQDGNLAVVGSDIALTASGDVSIGEGKEPTPKILFHGASKVVFSAATSEMKFETNGEVVAAKAKLKAESGDCSGKAAAIAAELTAGDAALLSGHNAAAKAKAKANASCLVPITSACAPITLGAMSGQGSSNPFGQPQSPFSQPQSPFMQPMCPASSGSSSGGNAAEESPFTAQWGPIFKTKNEHKEKNQIKTGKKYDDEGLKAPKYEHRLAIGQVELKKGALLGKEAKIGSNGTAWADVGQWKGKAYAYVGASKDGKPGIGAEIGGSFSGVDAGLKGAWGDEDLGIDIGGAVSMYRVDAKGEAALGFNKDGKFDAGASGEVGLYLAEGSVEGGLNIAKAKVKAKATGKVGFGLEGGIGLKNGKIKGKVGAVCIIGGSIEFEVDISKWLPF